MQDLTTARGFFEPILRYFNVSETAFWAGSFNKNNCRMVLEVSLTPDEWQKIAHHVTIVSKLNEYSFAFFLNTANGIQSPGCVKLFSEVYDLSFSYYIKQSERDGLIQAMDSLSV